MRGGGASAEPERPWTDRAVRGKQQRQRTGRSPGLPTHTSQPGTSQPAVGTPAGELAWSGVKLQGAKEALCLCLCWTRESRRVSRQTSPTTRL